MKMLSNTEVDLKKNVAYREKACSAVMDKAFDFHAVDD